MSHTLEREAARVGQELLGAPVRRCERITFGAMTFKFRVELDGGARFVVRFYPPNRSRVVDFEPDLIRRLGAEGLPVAVIVGDSRTGPPASLAYMVYEYLEGTPLSERFGALTTAARDRLARQLVGAMTGMGRIRLAGWGEPLTAWRAGSPSWEAFVTESFAEGLRSLTAHQLVERDLIDRLERIAGRLGRLIDPETGRLVWVDCNPENVLVGDRDALAGVVDLESVLVGDPLMPLGACHARFSGDAYFQTLVRAWPEAPSEGAWRRIHLLSILRALRVAAYGRQPLPTGQHRAALVEVFPGLREAAARLDPAWSTEPGEDDDGRSRSKRRDPAG